MSRQNGARWAAVAILAVISLGVVGCSSAADSGPSAAAGSTAAASNVASESAAAGASSGAAGSPASSTGAAAGAEPSTGDAPASGGAASVDQPIPTTQAAVTAPIPAPGGGDINQTVEAVPVTTADEVALTDSADFGGGVLAKVTSVQAIQAQAQGPGETAGAALAVTVQIDNGSAAPLSLATATVLLEDATGAPGLALTGDAASPFSSDLAPEASATGVYVFSVPESNRSPVKVLVGYSAGAPVVLFTGNAA